MSWELRYVSLLIAEVTVLLLKFYILTCSSADFSLYSHMVLLNHCLHFGLYCKMQNW